MNFQEKAYCLQNAGAMSLSDFEEVWESVSDDELETIKMSMSQEELNELEIMLELLVMKRREDIEVLREKVEGGQKFRVKKTKTRDDLKKWTWNDDESVNWWED